jgi:hypothetical protein
MVSAVRCAGRTEERARRREVRESGRARERERHRGGHYEERKFDEMYTAFCDSILCFWLEVACTEGQMETQQGEDCIYLGLSFKCIVHLRYTLNLDPCANTREKRERKERERRKGERVRQGGERARVTESMHQHL